MNALATMLHRKVLRRAKPMLNIAAEVASGRAPLPCLFY